MKDEMNLGTAQNIAKQLKNHYRAFEFLEGFVRKTVALEGTLKEFETRRDALQKEVEALEEKKKKLSGIEGHYSILETGVAMLEEKKRGMATVESDCARLEGERGELEKAVKELKGELQELKTRMTGSLKKIK